MNPLGEIFGFPFSNVDEKATRYRNQRLCPFNNIVPNCTKDKAENPLGVCSVIHNKKPVITCPVRFRQEWLIAGEAADFFFSKGAKWTSLGEVRLDDATGQSTGNIDYVLVSYDDSGKLLDFGSLEVQAVYISGNLRNPFDAYLQNPTPQFDWVGKHTPKPDYLSSSRKRLVPQMLYKGGILKGWGKKQAVVLQKAFFETLPSLPLVEAEKGDIAWFLHDLKLNPATNMYDLYLDEIVYTEFEPALLKITTPVAGKLEDFLKVLQGRLSSKLENPPIAPPLTGLF